MEQIQFALDKKDYQLLKKLVTPQNVNRALGCNERRILHALIYDHAPDTILRYVISQGADIHAENRYWYSPIISTATHNNINAMKILLEAGANINQINGNNTTALGQALIYSFEICWKYLIKMGADINPCAHIWGYTISRKYENNVKIARQHKQRACLTTTSIWFLTDSQLSRLPKDVFKIIIDIVQHADLDDWLERFDLFPEN